LITFIYERDLDTSMTEKEDFGTLSVQMHEKYIGKLETISKVPVESIKDLSIAYSPGVAQPCLEIQKDPSKLRDLVMNGKAVAVITDGSAVLGLGDIGPKASLPVMEGKCVLFKAFSGLNAIPLALDTQDVDKFVETVRMLAPSFGGINLEDISAPRCFEIEERLKAALSIPVFHDDQHGTAIVTLAGLINALKITKKNKEDIKVVINGAGAAGVAITKIFHDYGVRNMIACDSRGIIYKGRDNLNSEKEKLLEYTNSDGVEGSMQDAIKNADVFVGVSKADLLSKEDVQSMNKDPIIFGLANPNPEIKPELAKEAGAKVIATGRSDYPNQINNVLVFPGIFKGAINAGARDITDSMKLTAAQALADLVKDPSEDKIIPNPFDEGIEDAVAKAVEDEVKAK
jgi:malate dehydrogenase (oxaloacetate-decarboxylating)